MKLFTLALTTAMALTSVMTATSAGAGTPPMKADDTVCTNRAEYDRIRIGMSSNQVHTITGEWGTRLSGHHGHVRRWYHSCILQSLHPMTVTFRAARDGVRRWSVVDKKNPPPRPGECVTFAEFRRVEVGMTPRQVASTYGTSGDLTWRRHKRFERVYSSCPNGPRGSHQVMGWYREKHLADKEWVP